MLTRYKTIKTIAKVHQKERKGYKHAAYYIVGNSEGRTCHFDTAGNKNKKHTVEGETTCVTNGLFTVWRVNFITFSRITRLLVVISNNSQRFFPLNTFYAFFSPGRERGRIKTNFVRTRFDNFLRFKLSLKNVLHFGGNILILLTYEYYSTRVVYTMLRNIHLSHSEFNYRSFQETSHHHYQHQWYFMWMCILCCLGRWNNSGLIEQTENNIVITEK